MKAAAVVGAGLVGEKRARALAEVGVSVETVFDVDISRAEALVARLPAESRAVRTAVDAWAPDDVDFVVIATPHDMLTELALAAVTAGCDVLIEKPGARSSRELLGVRDEAARRGRLVRVGYNHRFHPSVLEAKRRIDAGELGVVINIRGRYGHGGRIAYATEWRADPARSGGGELLDQGTHLVDLTRFLIGDVTLEFCELRTDYWEVPVEDNAFLALRARSGPFVWLHASWTEWKNTFALEVACERGRLDLRGLGGSYGPERLTIHEMRPELGPPDTIEEAWGGPDSSWRHELEDVRLELAGGAPIGAGIDDALAVLKVVDEAYGR